MSTESKENGNLKKEEEEDPGKGWSNGDLPVSMFPLTRNGKLALYSSNRRWIGLNKGWTRIGQGATEMDARHASSQSAGGSWLNDEKKTNDDIKDKDNNGATQTTTTKVVDVEANTVKALLSQLCEQFYKFGWATGTGGGISIRVGGPTENRPFRVFVAPSGIQKEDMIGEDIFELDMERNIVQSPKTPNLRLSACTPLWYVVYKFRPTARAVIHTHSMNAQLATLLDPTEEASVLKLTHLEMLKGVGNHAYDDVLEIPIIDNRPSEDLLAKQLEAAITKYPKCNAVLVRRHGVYVWGDSWEQAKTQCESFDYLFESAIRMKQMGIIPGQLPPRGTYRVDTTTTTTSKEEEEDKKRSVNNEQEDRPSKKRKMMDGFHGKSAVNNQNDLDRAVIPLVPQSSRKLLLDIEGCTTSIAFVKNVLFPYVLEQLDSYLDGLQSQDDLSNIVTALEQDFNALDSQHPSQIQLLENKQKQDDSSKQQIIIMVQALMAHDVKAAGLKSLQGKMWTAGYENGKLKGHIYDDFIPLLQWCRTHKVDVYIYSSGSVKAQKLLFGHVDSTQSNNVLEYIKGHFDITTSGSKKEASSYEKIASSMKVSPSEIMFCSDAEAELVAAQKAGIGHVVMSIRPGNAPLTAVGREFPSIYSLLQICGV